MHATNGRMRRNQASANMSTLLFSTDWLVFPLWKRWTRNVYKVNEIPNCKKRKNLVTKHQTPDCFLIMYHYILKCFVHIRKTTKNSENNSKIQLQGKTNINRLSNPLGNINIIELIHKVDDRWQRSLWRHNSDHRCLLANSPDTHNIKKKKTTNSPIN